MRRVLVILGLTFAGAAGLAQVSLFDLGLGTRAMGLAGAYAALAEGSEGLLYNPAGLAQVRGIAVDSTVLSGLVGAGYVGAAIPGLGAGLGYLGASVPGPGEEALGFSQFGLVAGFALDLKMFGFPGLGGLSVRFQSTTIAGAGQTGFALDLGVLGRWPSAFGELRGALVIRELGFGGWSTEFVLAGAWLSPFGILAALDLTSEYVAVGLGWNFLGMAEVRAGFRQEGGFFRWALGLGVRFGIFTLDYGLLTHPALPPTHRFGFGVRF